IRVYLITVSNFIGVLQISGSADNILFVDCDPYVKIAPNTVEFSSYIWICVPAIHIIFSEFRIPLTHGKRNTFSVISSGSTNLNGNLPVKVHRKSSFLSG